MFPLAFPWSILRRHAKSGDCVLDPFCGRGTTGYAARLRGLENSGVDSSPIAATIALAKVVAPTPAEIVAEYDNLLATCPDAPHPEGEFWARAYAPSVLGVVVRLRAALHRREQSPQSVALTALVLGALHGPRNKHQPSYLSNQCQRTFAPKPDYAVRFWRRRQLRPPVVEVRSIIERRARRYYGNERSRPRGSVRMGDSRDAGTFTTLGEGYRWVITSPPYYGLRTYVPDQWLRAWFLGGPPSPDYSYGVQVRHHSPEDFSADLRLVWQNVAEISHRDATLVFRFGGINDRAADPIEIARESIRGSGWRWVRYRSAGNARNGRRQANHFLSHPPPARLELDVWARRRG